MAGQGMILMVLVGGAMLFMMSCQLGIRSLCEMTQRMGLGGGGGAAAKPQLFTETGELNPEALSEEEMALLQSQFGEEFPRTTLTEAMEYIANQAVMDIDRGTYTELGRDRVFDLKAELLDDYQGYLTQIAEYNDVRLQPLQGRALARYSLMILDLTRRKNIRLNPAYEAELRANLFAGSPTSGTPTANMAKARALAARNVLYLPVQYRAYRSSTPILIA